MTASVNIHIRYIEKKDTLEVNGDWGWDLNIALTYHLVS